MKKSYLKFIIKEIVDELLNHESYDVQGKEVEVDGKYYSVDASFEWKEESVDYQFDPKTNRGRDLIADIPFKIKSIRIEDENGNLESDKMMIDKIETHLIDIVRNDETMERNKRWGQWE